MRPINQINTVLGRIMETGGMIPEMEADLAIIRDEFQERDGFLREVGEPWDENAESFEFKVKPMGPAGDTVPKAQYDELKARYTQQFFGQGVPETPGPGMAQPTLPRDTAPPEIPLRESITVNDLFKEVPKNK